MPAALSMSRRALGAGVFGLLLAGRAAPPVLASPAPQTAVESFHATLLAMMKDAAKLGFKGRFEQIQPAMDANFDIATMTRLAVGSGWTGFTPDQQQRLVQAFRRFSASTYANRFDGYDGESFRTLGERDSGADKLVETELKTAKEPVKLTYLTRQTGSDWRIIDVLLTGTISELAVRRSEFGGIIRKSGADGLIQVLDERSDKLGKPAG